MICRRWLWGVPVVGALGLGALGVDRWLSAAPEARQELKPAVSLPVSRVVLFNSGVGFFDRQGKVKGDAEIELKFNVEDIGNRRPDQAPQLGVSVHAGVDEIKLSQSDIRKCWRRRHAAAQIPDRARIPPPQN